MKNGNIVTISIGAGVGIGAILMNWNVIFMPLCIGVSGLIGLIAELIYCKIKNNKKINSR